MKNICDRCKKTDCKYKNRPLENMTIFCADNCAAEYVKNAEAIKPELLKIVNTCENKAGFYGLFTQAAQLLKATEGSQEAEKNAEKLKTTAARFYSVFDPWEACDTSEEETAEEIQKNPLDAINYLLDIIENY